MDGFIYVDVETPTYVKVYANEEVEHDFDTKEFHGHNAKRDAMAYAAKEAERLGCDYGDNDY